MDAETIKALSPVVIAFFAMVTVAIKDYFNYRASLATQETLRQMAESYTDKVNKL